MSSMIRLLVWKSLVSLKIINDPFLHLLSVVSLDDGLGCSLNSLGSNSSLQARRQVRHSFTADEDAYHLLYIFNNKCIENVSINI